MEGRGVLPCLSELVILAHATDVGPLDDPCRNHNIGHTSPHLAIQSDDHLHPLLPAANPGQQDGRLFQILEPWGIRRKIAIGNYVLCGQKGLQ